MPRSMQQSVPDDFCERLDICLDRAYGNEHGRNVRAAQALKISTSSIAHWTGGRTYPNIPRLIQIAKDARVSLDWLLTGDMFDEDVPAVRAVPEVASMAEAGSQ